MGSAFFELLLPSIAINTRSTQHGDNGQNLPLCDASTPAVDCYRLMMMIIYHDIISSAFLSMQFDINRNTTFVIQCRSNKLHPHKYHVDKVRRTVAYAWKEVKCRSLH
ncbi:jg12808 [Pararge aegeria aegeria]|uniref:Jg12808 protein n=1 Tax=Pararge aegeria aegeria TaxID=348720 RepID=A0A8S4RLH6_9NEOP|nr:jg12808 [Pararge aegeria aegeria]